MFRKISEKDKNEYLSMAKDFYSSPAVSHNIPTQFIENTFDELMKSDTYADCIIFEENEMIVGYSLLAKTFSQEAGGYVIWIEEIFVKENYRGKGIGKKFFEYLDKNYSFSRLRLEAEKSNDKAIKLYKSLGFEELGYLQYIKE